jgi:hypothetical protein
MSSIGTTTERGSCSSVIITSGIYLKVAVTEMTLA